MLNYFKINIILWKKFIVRLNKLRIYEKDKLLIEPKGEQSDRLYESQKPYEDILCRSLKLNMFLTFNTPWYYSTDNSRETIMNFKYKI